MSPRRGRIGLLAHPHRAATIRGRPAAWSSRSARSASSCSLQSGRGPDGREDLSPKLSMIDEAVVDRFPNGQVLGKGVPLLVDLRELPERWRCRLARAVGHCASRTRPSARPPSGPRRYLSFGLGPVLAVGPLLQGDAHVAEPRPLGVPAANARRVPAVVKEGHVDGRSSRHRALTRQDTPTQQGQSRDLSALLPGAARGAPARRRSIPA
jgi:hypothetical protein